MDTDQVAAHGRAAVYPFDETRKREDAAARRAAPTPPEKLLDTRLKLMRPSRRFHREHEIHGWVVDFFFPDSRLVIEVDGATHRSRTEVDKRRDEHLSAYRYRTLRFSAREVLADVDEVVRTIEGHLAPIKPRRAPQEAPRLAKSDRVNLARQSREVLDEVMAQKERALHNAAVRAVRAAQEADRKHRFICQACGHTFIAPSEPWPSCRQCQTNTGVRARCRSCDLALAGGGLGRCAACLKQRHDIGDALRNDSAQWGKNRRPRWP